MLEIIIELKDKNKIQNYYTILSTYLIAIILDRSYDKKIDLLEAVNMFLI